MPCRKCSARLSSSNYGVLDGDRFCLECLSSIYVRQRTPPVTCSNCDGLTTIPNSEPARTERTIDHRSSSRSYRVSRNDSLRHTYVDRSPDWRTHVQESTRACAVCLDDLPSKHFQVIGKHRCKEANRTICNRCLAEHLEQAFKGVCTADLPCPELQCGNVLEYDAIKQILLEQNKNTIFERYDKFICRNFLETLEEFIWCSNPKCAMGQLNNGGLATNIVTCFRCYHKTCFTHKVPWHAGLSCEEYELKTDPNLQADMQWITQNTKQCPKCSYRIEKNDGCDHMRCIKCQYEFCWACLADFDQIRKDGNHRHDPGCKHYAAYNGL